MAVQAKVLAFHLSSLFLSSPPHLPCPHFARTPPKRYLAGLVSSAPFKPTCQVSDQGLAEPKLEGAGSGGNLVILFYVKVLMTNDGFTN